MSKIPTMFIPHGGGPCFFMEWNPPDTWDKERQFLVELPATLPKKPIALLVISSHWEEPHFTVQTNPAPPLLFDYYGFPPETYQLTWPASGDPTLAEKVLELLKGAGLSCGQNDARGYDHGVFVPLKVAFPEADIPTVQLSLKSGLDPSTHLAAGRALAPLRDEGVLIIGSGNTYHNMQVMMQSMRGSVKGEPRGLEFDRWLTDAVTQPDPNERHKMLTEWANGPRRARCQPARGTFDALTCSSGCCRARYRH